ncbi:MAG: DUF192 domain-containing protein, partial [Cyclobacteriaceae bacterium]
YGRGLPFREEMSGSVEIITEELNLLERIFYDLRRRLDQKDIPAMEKLTESAEVHFLDVGGNIKTRLTVEVARTREEIEKGLMYRSVLEADRGMLFVQPSESPGSIWMKNTNISLDIIFIDAGMNIIKVYENAKPMSRKVITTTQPVRYTLEVNAGFARTHNIAKQDQVAIIFN